MKILKPYCTTSRHTQWDPRVSFLKSLKCRRSSSDKLFFRTDGRTERGNNNIPELSLESAGIKITSVRFRSGLFWPTFVSKFKRVLLQSEESIPMYAWLYELPQLVWTYLCINVIIVMAFFSLKINWQWSPVFVFRRTLFIWSLNIMWRIFICYQSCIIFQLWKVICNVNDRFSVHVNIYMR